MARKSVPARRLSTSAEQDFVLTDEAGREIHVEVRLRRTDPSDPLDALKELFGSELRSLLGDALPDEGAVRRAARLAVAEQAWRQRLGELLETADVMELLGVSRQRVSKLVGEHRLIALPQDGRLRFPAWQFVLQHRNARERLAQAHAALVETGHVSPWSAASWCVADHPELEGHDPVSWLQDGRDGDTLLAVAGRDAARLAQ
jgi:hypothetical protein